MLLQRQTLLDFFQRCESDHSSRASIVEQYQKISLNKTFVSRIGDFSVINAYVLSIEYFSRKSYNGG